MNKTRLAPLAVALLVILAADVAFADVLRLRTGEVVKCRPLREHSDEHVLVVRDLLSGALRSFAWDTLEQADRERLQTDWRITNPTLAPVGGHRITVTMEDGTTLEVFGLIVDRESGVTLLRGGKEMKIPKERLVAVESAVLDPRDIWSPMQLVARFFERLRAEGADLRHLSAREHFRVAENARIVGAFETAHEHYAACAGSDGFLSAPIARKRLAEMEALLQNQAELQALRRIRTAVARRSFRRARALLAEFKVTYPVAGKSIREALEKVEVFATKKRLAHFQMQAKYRFPKLVHKLIATQVRDPEVELADVVAWTRRELPEAAYAALAADFRRWDDVTPDEARAFWQQRLTSAWRTASYGSGTFIVERPKVTPPKRKPGSGAAAGRTPKPPTRDLWWRRASRLTRSSWVMAYFAERSGLFELSQDKTRMPCPTCGGKGFKGRHICPRCGGTLADRRVRFR